jgi:hypothetical protein
MVPRFAIGGEFKGTYFKVYFKAEENKNEQDKQV